MKSRKEKLACQLDRFGFFEVMARFPRPGLIIFGYHRIRPDQAGQTNEFDDDVFGPTQSQFRMHVDWLRKHARIISEDELLNILATRRPPKKRCVMLTFDDGYRDNFKLAYPVLKEYQVPAMFFIPTLSISNRTLGWWDIIAYCIKNSRKDAIHYDGQTLLLKSDKQAAKIFFLEKMKATACGHTADLLARLADTCEVDFPSRAIQDAQLMTWDHIREMALGGMGIGSHGHTHRVMATLPRDVQEEEMRLSREILATKLDIPIRSIAYPVGDYTHFTHESKDIARTCGYQLGFSFNTGYTSWEGSDHFNMRRLGGPEDLGMIKGIVTLPKVFTRDSKKNKRGEHGT